METEANPPEKSEKSPKIKRKPKSKKGKHASPKKVPSDGQTEDVKIASTRPAPKPKVDKKQVKIVELSGKVNLLEKTVGEERRRAIAAGLERDQLQLLLSTTTDKFNDEKSQVWLKSREFEEQTKQYESEEVYLRQKLKNLLRVETDKLHQTILEHLEKVEDKPAVVEFTKDPDNQPVYKNQDVVTFEPLPLPSTSYSNTADNGEPLLSKMKFEYEEKLKNLDQLCQLKLKRLQEDLTAKYKKEISLLSQDRTVQFHQLTEKHDEQLADLKRTYEIKDQLQLQDISDLQDKLKRLSKTNESLEKQLEQSRVKCDSLQSSLNDLNNWKSANSLKLSQANNQTKELQVLKAQLLGERKVSEGLRIDTEKTIKRCKQIEKERDRLYDCFMNAIGEIDKRAEEKSELVKTQLLEVRSILDSWQPIPQ